MKKTTKTRLIIIGVLVTAATITAAVCGTFRGPKSKETQTKIEVTEDEISQYKEMIGDSMNIKKAVFILFNNEEECRAFIDEHGSDKEPHMAGKGTIPLMENGYYNIVGKAVVEEVFDKLKDGEHTTEPFIYSGMYCYLKRIGVESPLDDEKKLKELIVNEKRQKEAK